MSFDVPSAIVAIYGHKGGIGKSTCGFCFVCEATRLGFEVLFIGADPQGDTSRWTMGSNTRRRKNTYLKSDLGFTFLCVDIVPPSNKLEELLSTRFDLIVIDLPPFPESILSVSPDLWIVPISNSDSLLNTVPMIKNMKLKGGRIGFLPNDLAGGNVVVERIINGLKSFIEHEPSSLLLPEIPRADSLKRVAEEHQPPWQVSDSSDTDVGVVAVRNCSRAILRVLAGLPFTSSVSGATHSMPTSTAASQEATEMARQRNIHFWEEMNKLAKKGPSWR